METTEGENRREEVTEQNQAPSAFSAREYAIAFRIATRSAQRMLAAISSSTSVAVNGNATPAWKISALPLHKQNELHFAAAKEGYRDALAMMSAIHAGAHGKKWSCPIPLQQVPASAMEKAANWREALRGTWTRREAADVSRSELARVGMADFKAVFGYTISERQWIEVFNRTIERDGGAEEFERIELYLDENVRPQKVRGLSEETLDRFAELEAVMNRWPDRARPSSAQVRLLWINIFELFEERIQNGTPEKRLKRHLLDYLMDRAPFLSQSAASIRVTFGKKYTRWLQNERSATVLRDQRAEKSGHRRGPELTQEEWAEEIESFIAYAVANCAGRIAQAWRERMRDRLAHPKIIAYYISNPSSKSSVPKRYIEATRTDVRLLDAIHRSKSNFRANGAHLVLDWTASWSNQAHCSDDTTLPVYFYETDGKGGYELQRGQFLVTIDVRSLRVLGWVLIPERNYNSFAIHTLYTQVWSEFGLPEIILHEGGIWDKARLLKGKQIAEDEALPSDEIELGLREFGVKFRHAREARAKPVERVIGHLQSYMERLPGYCGRDEIRDRYDEFQRLKKDVDARRISPVGIFYSRAEWEAKLTEIVEAYNSAEQDGKILGGRSPDRAFEEFQNTANPPTKFEPSCRYLLAHYRRPMTVGRNGITITIGKKSFNYHNEETGARIGERVLCWFNPEAPELLTVTTLDRRNPVCIPQTLSVPALNASAEQLAEERAKVEAHQGYGLRRYHLLKTKFKQIFRKNVVDRATVQLGAEMAAQQEAQREAKQHARRNNRLASQLGVALPQERAGTAAAGERLKDFKSALEEAEEEARETEL
jgi:hypothetical protein